MNVLKTVCGSLGAVVLTAGTLWAFAEPTPPPTTAAPIAACSAGKCGATACPTATCDAAVTVTSSCQDNSCLTAAKECSDPSKTLPNSDYLKTIPVAVTESCCKADSACVTESSCKSAKCDGNADGCDGECCEAGTCKSKCCDDRENVSADACPTTGKGCCDDKTVPVSVTTSECEEGACPVSAKSCCESKCSAKDKSCDGECCKDDACKSECGTEKVSADACPTAKKDCCDDTVAVSVTNSECKGGLRVRLPAGQDASVSNGTFSFSVGFCRTSDYSQDKTCDGECRKNVACKLECRTEKISADACPEQGCCDKTVPVSVTESACKDGTCPVSAKSCCESKCSAKDKDCDGECCKAGTCKAACCDEKVSTEACPAAKKDCCDKTVPVGVKVSDKDRLFKVIHEGDSAKDKNCDGECCEDGTCQTACCHEKVSADACPAAKKDCCEKTAPVAATTSECHNGTCPVSAKASCESTCDEKGKCPTAKVAACSMCGTDGCQGHRVAADTADCRVQEKCSTSGGCDAACPASPEPVTAKTPEDAAQQPQASRSDRRIRYMRVDLFDGPTVRVVKTKSISAPKPAVRETNQCGVVNGSRQIMAALVSACVKTALPADRECRAASKTEQAPPQSAEPTNVITHQHAGYPVHSYIISEDAGSCPTYGECPNSTCPIEGGYHTDFVDAELGPPCAQFASTAFSCPMCAHEHPAMYPVMHPPRFHPHRPEFAGPPPGFVRLHSGEFPMPPARIVAPILGAFPPHHGFGPSWTAPPIPAFEPLMPVAPPLAWRHPWIMHQELVPQAPFLAGPPVIAAGADEEHSIMRSYVRSRVALPEMGWRMASPHHEQFPPAPPRIPVRMVSFEGDAPAPGLHPAHRPAPGPRHHSMPIEGSWMQQSGDTTIRVTCEPSQIRGTATVAAEESDEQTSIEFSGTCSVAPDGQVFGVIDHLSMTVPGESPRDVQTFASKMVDQPFAIRFRTDGETLFIKDVKCAGVESLGIVDKRGDVDSFLNVFACGKYTRDGK